MTSTLPAWPICPITSPLAKLMHAHVLQIDVATAFNRRADKRRHRIARACRCFVSSRRRQTNQWSNPMSALRHPFGSARGSRPSRRRRRRLRRAERASRKLDFACSAYHRNSSLTRRSLPSRGARGRRLRPCDIHAARQPPNVRTKPCALLRALASSRAKLRCESARRSSYIASPLL